MTRFLHTADWQLGLKLRFLDGDRGAKLRLERFEVVRRLAAAAHEHAVEAVVVAGDVFDDNAVGAATLQAARDALAAFAPIPVLLLPGNHDAATPESALRRLAPEEHGLDHVRPLLVAEPLTIGDTVYYPCPLLRRHTHDDPTRWLPSRQDGTHEDGDAVRVAIAHGGVLDFGESTESPNLIAAEEVLARGFDYLALGDWHGLLRFGSAGWGDRVWYSGTPEPTRFEEKEPGRALVVEIDGAGEEPRVEVLELARSRWLTESRTLDGEAAVDELERWLKELPERSWTLLRLQLDGALSLAQRARLDRLLAAAGEELLELRLDDGRLVTEPSEEDLAQLRLEGFVGRAVERLRKESTREEDGAAAQGALRLLYRLLQEES
ncbi:MAG: metallophosphoesterase [Acidobacteriota bacterium]|nr:metallophosphoesterase [Acidobacteriota bacterium]